MPLNKLSVKTLPDALRSSGFCSPPAICVFSGQIADDTNDDGLSFIVMRQGILCVQLCNGYGILLMSLLR